MVEDAVAFVANHMKDLSPSLLKPLAEYYGMMTAPVSLWASPGMMDTLERRGARVLFS